MKIQILVDGQVASTQIVSETLYAVKPTLREAKLIALKAALEDRTITVSHSLKATFRVFNVQGTPVDD